MFTPAMTKEELYKEAVLESSAISTQVNMFRDVVKKKFIRLNGKIGYQRKTIRTKRNNEWTVLFFAFKEELGSMVYAPIINGNSYDGYISIDLYTKRDVSILHFTTHFIKRYNERYIKHYGIEIPQGLNLVEYFTINNGMVFCMDKEDGNGSYTISNHGLYISALFANRMTSLITFIGDDELSLKKQLVYDNQLNNYYVFSEIVQMFYSGRQIESLTIYFVSKKYDADIEALKLWYKWTNRTIPDKIIESIYDTIRNNNICSSNEFYKFMKENVESYYNLLRILYEEYSDNYKNIASQKLGLLL